MQSQNPLIADFVKLANSAAGTLAGMSREARDSAREKMKEAMGGLDFVAREEFDAVKAMAAKARELLCGAHYTPAHPPVLKDEDPERPHIQRLQCGAGHFMVKPGAGAPWWEPLRAGGPRAAASS